MSRTPATLADAWDAYAADVLPIDAPEAEVTRARRAFYAAALDVSRMVAAGVRPEQITRECIGFGRALGSMAERAESAHRGA